MPVRNHYFARVVPAPMAEGDTLANALLGAVVTVVFSLLPFSPLLGGLLAGYLEGGDRNDGVRVGAISGVIALVPILGFLALVGGAWIVFLLGGMPFRAGAVLGVVALFILAFLAIFTVGLSALGGWLGNYVATDTNAGR